MKWPQRPKIRVGFMRDEELLNAIGPEGYASYLNHRTGLRYSLLKVLAGTLAVSVVSVMTPAIIDRIRIATQDQKDRRDYVAKFLQVALNQDVDYRIRFAKYLAQVAPEDADRKLWGSYLESLEADKALLAAKTDQLAKLAAAVAKNRALEQQVVREKEAIELQIASLTAELARAPTSPTRTSFEQSGALATPYAAPQTKAQKLADCAIREYNSDVKEGVHPNSSPRIDQYLAAVGAPPGYAWSGAFLAYCIRQAGGAGQIKLSGAVANLMQGAKASGIFHPNDGSFVPAVGDLMVILRPTLRNTGGIVTSYDPAGRMLTTIEGNQAMESGHSGDRIAQVQRRLDESDIVGFARLRD
jgi:hypothetical protein